MKRLGIVGTCFALSLVLAAPAGIATARSGGKTKVVCLDEQTLKPEYRVTPKHCVFHERHTPRVEADIVRTKHDHWIVWHRDNAKGRGRQQPSMGSTTPVRIRLRDPVRRCGHRVFSKAHFRYPKLGGNGSTMRLDLCA